MFKNKEIIRKEIIRLRESQSKQEVLHNSDIIINKLIESNEYLNSKVVMGYMDFRKEVMTERILKDAFNKGKKVAIPRISKINGHQKGIIAYEIKEIGDQIERGTFGVMEPKNDCNIEINPEHIDLVIVPGVAFDKYGYRIGFGAGYYDMFLKNIRHDCVKIGLAFEMQIIEDLPIENHDIPVDIIITEKQIIIPDRKGLN